MKLIDVVILGLVGLGLLTRRKQPQSVPIHHQPQPWSLSERQILRDFQAAIRRAR